MKQKNKTGNRLAGRLTVLSVWLLAFAFILTGCDTGPGMQRQPRRPSVVNHHWAATSNSITISWRSDYYNWAEYRIERSNSQGGPWNSIHRLPAATGSTHTTFTDTGLSQNTTMYYRVIRIVNGVDSEPSPPLSARTLQGDGATGDNQPNGNQPGTGTDPGTTLAAQLDRLRTNASGSSYVLYVRANESLSPRVLDSANLNGRSGITLRLRSTGSQHTVNIDSQGALFTVGSGVTLILENNVILRGSSNNHQALGRRSNPQQQRYWLGQLWRRGVCNQNRRRLF